MKSRRTEIEGLLFIEPKVFDDSRGFFLETHNHESCAAELRPLQFGGQKRDGFNRALGLQLGGERAFECSKIILHQPFEHPIVGGSWQAWARDAGGVWKND